MSYGSGSVKPTISKERLNLVWKELGIPCSVFMILEVLLWARNCTITLSIEISSKFQNCTSTLELRWDPTQAFQSILQEFFKRFGFFGQNWQNSLDKIFSFSRASVSNKKFAFTHYIAVNFSSSYTTNKIVIVKEPQNLLSL